MSKLQVNDIVNKDDDGSVGFSKGAVVTGVVTATSFVGSGEGLTGVASTDNIITGTAATFNNNVNISGITTVGVLTAYSQVNVVGVLTATTIVGNGAAITGLPAGFTELDAALFN